MIRKILTIIASLVITTLFSPSVIFASGTDAGHVTSNLISGPALLAVIAVILIAAKFFHLIEKINQPPVVGELLAGIMLGNLGLIGLHFFNGVTNNEVIHFLAEMGVILLLFQIGLESNIKELTSVGAEVMLVACIGVLAPFFLATYVVGPMLLPDYGVSTHLFLGAALSATSVGITARVFKDMGRMNTRAAKVVTGAAVVDDILALVLLAVVSSLVENGSVSPIEVGLFLGKSFLFLGGSVLIGQALAPYIGKVFAKIHTGGGSKFTLSVSFGLLLAALAQSIGMEAIVGAFAAGLVLDPVHFKYFQDPSIVSAVTRHLEKADKKAQESIARVLRKHADHNVEELIEPLSLFFVPIFFVFTGMKVHLETLFDFKTIILALVISVVAVFGKFIAGAVIKSKDKWIIGMAMVPRGEVGLIFAAVGQSLGVLTDQMFSVVVLTILITTVVGPAFLTNMLKNES